MAQVALETLVRGGMRMGIVNCFPHRVHSNVAVPHGISHPSRSSIMASSNTQYRPGC